MENSSSSSDYPCFFLSNPNPTSTFNKKKLKKKTNSNESDDESTWPRKTGEVMLEGYVEASAGDSDQASDGGDGVGRTKSLTDEDLEELKGCLDLGFGFSYDEIPELCNTLPALELCYSMSQRFLDDQNQNQNQSENGETTSAADKSSAAPIANWKISSPGDHPEEVKARLKYWAQAVACTVRLCS